MKHLNIRRHSLAVLLVALAAFMLCSFSALAEDPMPIKLGSAVKVADEGIYDDYFWQLMKDKFNIEPEIYSSGADFDTLTNLWIATGDMPDVLNYGDDLAALKSYAEQGLLAALPEGWEEKYPNLYADVAACDLEDYCTLDGKTYILPRIVMPVTIDLPLKGELFMHNTSYYRLDWAKELGSDIDTTATMDQLKAYVKAAIDANLDNATTIYGVVGTRGMIKRQLIETQAPYYDKIYWDGSQYVLGAQATDIIYAIQNLKEWYEEGLLYPDFYTATDADSRNMYAAGNAALLCDRGVPEKVQIFAENFTKYNEKVTDPSEALGCVNLLAPNGKYRFLWASVYYHTLVFSPTLEDEPEKFDRILQMIDWMATPEGIYTMHLGEKGVNWDYDENGAPVTLEHSPENDYTYGTGTGANIYMHVCDSCQDAWFYVDPSFEPWYIERDLQQRVAKQENADPDMPKMKDVLPFTLSTSSNKELFDSIDWDNEMWRIIMDKNADVEKDWNAFIEANRSLWQPILDEMNAQAQ